MHGPTPHNPLRDAARETLHAAREVKSPLLERVAIFTMIGSALSTMAFGAVQMWHMVRRDLERDREKERDRRAAPASPPRASGIRWHCVGREPWPGRR